MLHQPSLTSLWGLKHVSPCSFLLINHISSQLLGVFFLLPTGFPFLLLWELFGLIQCADSTQGCASHSKHCYSQRHFCLCLHFEWTVQPAQPCHLAPSNEFINFYSSLLQQIKMSFINFYSSLLQITLSSFCTTPQIVNDAWTSDTQFVRSSLNLHSCSHIVTACLGIHFLTQVTPLLSFSYSLWLLEYYLKLFRRWKMWEIEIIWRQLLVCHCWQVTLQELIHCCC